MKTVTCMLIALSASACIGTQYSQTGAVAAARDPNCTFQVLAMQPSEPHRELGIIDFTGNQAQRPSKVPDLVKLIRADVCRAGGDAVVAPTDGDGYYVRAVVVLREPAPKPSP